MVHVVGIEEVREGIREAGSLAELALSIGHEPPDPDFVANVLRVPFHLATLVRVLRERDELREGMLDSIPFHSLCRAVFLPLEGITPERAAQLFGLVVEPSPTGADREERLRDFLHRDLGLTPRQKVGCLLGDPFEGRPGTFKRESLLRLLGSLEMVSRRRLLDRLTLVGDVAILFAENRKDPKASPPLTAAEVLHSLRILPELGRNLKFEHLRSLISRCGKLEAFFVVKLILGKAGLRYEGELLARLVAEQFGVDTDQIRHAMALVDAFEVVRLLEKHGPDGLRRIELQPLVPVRPALAGGSTDGLKSWPVWVERKYDGIRLMLHKATDRIGSVLCGAYSRNRRDYLEGVSGLQAAIRALPAHSAIVDGELYGTVMTTEGMRPATVYEVFGALQGEAPRPVRLRFAAFDVIYLNGLDLTPETLRARRQKLQMLVAPLANMPLPIPVSLAEGQMAGSKEDLNRLYQHFRSQGYEGILTKNLDAPYRLATRDPGWLKRKPEVTLDLVVLGAVLAVTSKERAGVFGSYVIGARTPDGAYEDVGDVAGVDVHRDRQIQQIVMGEGLVTGRRIERASASGTRPGFELTPHLVVTVRFEGTIRDPVSGAVKLRDPKLVAIRADKTPPEADTTKTLEEMHLRERVG